MASMRGRVCGAHIRTSKCVLEDELSRVSTNMIQQEFDGDSAAMRSALEESAERSERKGSKTEAGIVTNNMDNNGKDEIGIRQYFVDFCRQTILHGWHYLVDYEDSDDDSQEDLSDIACPSKTSPDNDRFKQRSYNQSQSLDHHVQSTHNVRNRHSRHSTTRTKNKARKTYSHGRSLPRNRAEVFGDHRASTKYEERGKYQGMHFKVFYQSYTILEV